MTLYEYIEKYGNMTFKEKAFNEIDNMVFSLIVYLDFNDLLDGESCTIEYVANKFFEILRPYPIPKEYEVEILNGASFIESYAGFVQSLNSRSLSFPINTKFISDRYLIDGTKK